MSEVKDYGEPIRIDNRGQFVDSHDQLRSWTSSGSGGMYWPPEIKEEVIRRFNLLAGFQTDPMKMTKRQELIIGLLRAEAEGDEGAFRGNLDDLAASEMLVEGETFEEGIQIQEKFSASAKNWHAKEYHYYEPDKMEYAKKVLEAFRRNNPDFCYRIVRVLTKTKVIE